MTVMNGPWYNIEDALDILQLRYSELIYAVEQNQIRCCIYTKPRKLMAVTLNAEKKMVGHASFFYSGHLTFSNKLFLRLLDEGEETYSPYCSLLENNKVSDWSGEYPYSQAFPNEAVAGWESLGRDTFVPNLYYFPYREEGNSVVRGIAEMVGKASGATKEFWSEEGEELYQGVIGLDKVFSWASNAKWNKDDIRIARTEIDDFLAPPKEALEVSVEEVLPKNGERTSQLHALVKRTLVKNPGIKATAVWQLLRDDCDSDKPIYDIDGILTSVSANTLDWASAYDHEQEFKRKSLPSLISRLKSKL